MKVNSPKQKDPASCEIQRPGGVRRYCSHMEIYGQTAGGLKSKYRTKKNAKHHHILLKMRAKL